jgi:hypothetical protein
VLRASNFTNAAAFLSRHWSCSIVCGPTETRKPPSSQTRTAPDCPTPSLPAGGYISILGHSQRPRLLATMWAGEEQVRPSRKAIPYETRCATRVARSFGDEWVSPQREVMRAGRASEQIRSTPSHNLPAARSSFVGRERELIEVQRELETTRLLTLTGVGGSGKTRLALEVARDLVQDTRRPSAGSRRASPPQKSWAIGGTSPTSWRARASWPVRGARRAGRRDFWVPRRL